MLEGREPVAARIGDHGEFRGKDVDRGRLQGGQHDVPQSEQRRAEGSVLRVAGAPRRESRDDARKRADAIELSHRASVIEVPGDRLEHLTIGFRSLGE
ncbi:MAG: hypothetical protein KC729_00360 [Candidatus Eisenbacteria bacterium]|uniref:Uncharacterized protein n=1 Tax=Eiseniibacteriota bacterium TaxID=2212470 RepID=A0A956RN89_UNCEI|nr:hypothetical protein [Candidatus Eisenbacteria bacterium]